MPTPTDAMPSFFSVKPVDPPKSEFRLMPNPTLAQLSDAKDLMRAIARVRRAGLKVEAR